MQTGTGFANGQMHIKLNLHRHDLAVAHRGTGLVAGI